jgi:hypothetical protein
VAFQESAGENFLFVLRVSSDAREFAMNVGFKGIGSPIRFVLWPESG